MKKLTGFLLSSVFLSAALHATADPVIYQNAGSIAVSHSFLAASTGEVNAYLYGTTANDDESLGLLVNGVSTGIWGLENHSAAYGQELSFGSVNAGSALTFQIFVQNTGYTLTSDPALNADGINHAYTHSFAGNGIIPAGTYIGFEDLMLGAPSDLNYNDDTFVVTNVAAAAAIPQFRSFAQSVRSTGTGLACLNWPRVFGRGACRIAIQTLGPVTGSGLQSW